MFGKLQKSALIAPVVAVLLMIAAPVPAPAAEEGRDGVFSRQGRWTDQQDRWRDGRDGRLQRRAEWRGDRRDDRRDRWGDRRDDRRDRWGERRGDRQDRRADRREHRQEWWQNRWRRHWDRWDSRAAQRRHRHRTATGGTRIAIDQAALPGPFPPPSWAGRQARGRVPGARPRHRDPVNAKVQISERCYEGRVRSVLAEVAPDPGLA